MFKQNSILHISLCSVVFILLSSFAKSETIVVNSLSKNFVAGQKLKDDFIIHLETKEQVRVMDESTGETKLIMGPFDGLVSSYKTNCQGVVGCKMVAPPKHVGATRALKK